VARHRPAPAVPRSTLRRGARVPGGSESDPDRIRAVVL